MADGEVTIGELSRQVQSVLLRFEGLLTRLDTAYVQKENFNTYRELVNNAIRVLQEAQSKLATQQEVKALEQRVVDLEDDKKWITRLLIGFIILAVLGAVFAVSGGLPK